MFGRVRRAAILLSAAACVVTFTPWGAVAQTYPPNAPTCEVSQGTVAPGESVTVSGENWLPNSTVTISLEGVSTLGTATTNDEGSFSTVVTIPASAPIGATEITCRGQDRNGDPFEARTTIKITAAGIVPAFTGAAVEVWTILAISLFVVGLGLIFISRRRRTTVRR